MATTVPDLVEAVAKLKVSIESLLAASKARQVAWAVSVEGLGMLEGDGARLMNPNSTQKLYTAGAVLLELGAARRLTTGVAAVGRLAPDGSLHGDLSVIASGDPALTGNDVAGLASRVAGAGIRYVKGNLIVDDTRYDRVASNPHWESHFVPLFSGPLSALAIDENRWRRDDNFIRSAPRANAGRIFDELHRYGVQICGSIRVEKSPAGGSNVAAHHSRPSLQLVENMLKTSNNFAAELLLKELGGRNRKGTTAAGLEMIKACVGRLGVEAIGTATDGSGLSRTNRDSPRRQVKWLLALDESPAGALLRRCLPEPAGWGNLEDRLLDSFYRGKVLAKTGTRTYNRSVNLAGFAETVSGRKLVFSFMLSGAASLSAAREAVSAAVLAAISADI